MRPLEIEKIISLLRLDPVAFMQLRATGACDFAWSEQLFDQDFPGHYARRIKSVSVTLPAVLGPYETVNGTLTQVSSFLLLQPDAAGRTYLAGGGSGDPPASVVADYRAGQQIALSRGTNDSGLFQVDLRDERYLPFEGTGAVSRWHLEIPQAFNRVDLSTLSDVIFQVSYTARASGGQFQAALTSKPAPLSWVLLVPLSQELPDGLATLRASGSATFRIDLRRRLPARLRTARVTVASAGAAADFEGSGTTVEVDVNGARLGTLSADTPWLASQNVGGTLTDPWSVGVKASPDAAALKELVLWVVVEA